MLHWRKMVPLLAAMLLLAACSKPADKPATEAPATVGATEPGTTEANATQAAKVEIEKGVVDLDELKAQGKPVILQYSQDGCPPCETMLPYFKSLQDEFKDVAVLRYVDVRENTKIVLEHNVQFTPTQVFLDADGNYFEPKEIKGLEITENEEGVSIPKHIGLMTEEDLRTVLEQMGVTQ